MNQIFSALYEKYFDSISNILQTFSQNTWVLIGLTFIGFIVRLPLLLIIPLSYGSYLAVNNEQMQNFIRTQTSVSPSLIVFSIWIVSIFLRLFVFKKNSENGYSSFIKNTLSFMLIFVLTLSLGTPEFEASALKDFKFIIMIGIFLYAIFHIFKHSITLLKNLFITFAWIFIITLLGMQGNQNYFRNIFNSEKLATVNEIKEEFKNSSFKNTFSKNIPFDNNAKVSSYLGNNFFTK